MQNEGKTMRGHRSAAAPRVLITGAGGFLGVRLARLYAAGCRDAAEQPAAEQGTASTPDKAGDVCTETTRGEAAAPQRVVPTWRGAQALACAQLTACTRAQMDLTDSDAVRRVIEAAAPDVVYHCAAVSDMGAAQRDPALSYAINVAGTLHVAAACKAVGAKLVAMSSDQVYNGTTQSGALPETAPLHPENVYGRQKLEAEQRVLALLPEAVFLRLTWMYDVPDTPLRMNGGLLRSLADAAKAGVPLRMGIHDFRGITDVWRVAWQLPVAADFAGGAYNFGSACTANAYETACEAAACMGLNPAPVVPDAERFAPHGRNLAMNAEKAHRGGACFPDTGAGIAQAVRRMRGGTTELEEG